jgi:hypothetical protein
MNYGVEMCSGAMIYSNKFHKDWFRHPKINREGFTDTQTAWRSHKPTFIFLKNKESRLKRQSCPCEGLIKHHAMSTHGEVEV